MDRPKVKDLKARYHYDGFFLSGDGVLGSYVCMFENPRSNRIAGYLRRRGFIVGYENHGLGGVWWIKNGDKR